MIILLTGCPGTGKSMLAKALKKELASKIKKKTILINVSNFINKQKVSCGYDKKNKCCIIDEKILRKEFNNYLNENNIKKDTIIIIDSHILFLTKSKVDFTYVLNCNIKVLYKRLKLRKYNERKIKDNLDSEIFDYCFNESLDKKYNKVTKLENTTQKQFASNLKYIVNEVLKSG